MDEQARIGPARVLLKSRKAKVHIIKEVFGHVPEYLTDTAIDKMPVDDWWIILDVDALDAAMRTAVDTEKARVLLESERVGKKFKEDAERILGELFDDVVGVVGYEYDVKGELHDPDWSEYYHCARKDVHAEFPHEADMCIFVSFTIGAPPGPLVALGMFGSVHQDLDIGDDKVSFDPPQGEVHVKESISSQYPKYAGLIGRTPSFDDACEAIADALDVDELVFACADVEVESMSSVADVIEELGIDVRDRTAR